MSEHAEDTRALVLVIERAIKARIVREGLEFCHAAQLDIETMAEEVAEAVTEHFGGGD